MAQRQISIYELMQKKEEIELPEVRDDEKAFRIPQDVWETRCQHCVHKVGKENIPVPMWMAYKHKYENVIPCRIIGICHPNDMPGECMNFAPKIGTWGICESCKYNSGIFRDRDFCNKKYHAERRRVFYGTHYGGDERCKEYWGTFRLSTCDDYEPNEYAKERRAEDERRLPDTGGGGGGTGHQPGHDHQMRAEGRTGSPVGELREDVQDTAE